LEIHTAFEEGIIYLTIYVYVYGDGVKTTVMLRDDIHGFLVTKFGKRGLSQAVNDLLYEHIFKEKEGMFGSDAWLAKASRKDLRDHEDRDV
jgi:hypothetical protein